MSTAPDAATASLTLARTVGASINHSIIDGTCAGSFLAGNYSVESPGSTCGLGVGSLVDVTNGALNIGFLADNGGLSHTIMPQPGSVAIGLGGAGCQAVDQRNFRRESACDAGAVQADATDVIFANGFNQDFTLPSTSWQRVRLKRYDPALSWWAELMSRIYTGVVAYDGCGAPHKLRNFSTTGAAEASREAGQPVRGHGDSAAARQFARAAVAIGLVASCVPAHADMFACAGNSIRVFADGASANDAPVRTIAGPTTGVNECYDVAYDAVHDEIVVAHGPLSTFAGSATGDAAPLRRIYGDMTGLGFAVSIAIDTQSDELVVGTTGPLILAFARTANGNVPALRSFAPAAIDVPVALYVDRVRDEVIVSKYGSPGLVAYFDRTSGSTLGKPNPVPVNIPRGLYVNPASGAVTVAAASGVLTFDHGGSQVSYFNYPPALTSPWGLAVMADTETWVGNQSGLSTDPDALLLFPAGAQGSAALSRQINNGAPASTNLYGIASSRSQGCGAGHVACDSVFRANFDITFR